MCQLRLITPRNLTINRTSISSGNISFAGSTISVDASSLVSASELGILFTDPYQANGKTGGGGGHGGDGACGCGNGTACNPAIQKPGQSLYDSLSDPYLPGGTGSIDPRDSNANVPVGGGVIRLDAIDRVVVNGVIEADGGDGEKEIVGDVRYPRGGAAGGSIVIYTSNGEGKLEGAGTLSVNGGIGTMLGGGGGGGRIAVYKSGKSTVKYKTWGGTSEPPDTTIIDGGRQAAICENGGSGTAIDRVSSNQTYFYCSGARLCAVTRLSAENSPRVSDISLSSCRLIVASAFNSSRQISMISSSLSSSTDSLHVRTGALEILSSSTIDGFGLTFRSEIFLLEESSITSSSCSIMATDSISIKNIIYDSQQGPSLLALDAANSITLRRPTLRAGTITIRAGDSLYVDAGNFLATQQSSSNCSSVCH